MTDPLRKITLRSMFQAEPELVRGYFDHGATSFPKPRGVAEAMLKYIERTGGTYGRAAYGQAQEASRLIFEARERLARLIGAPGSRRLAFTLNATHALNLAIQGICRAGGRILVSPLEHNSVMRPLTLLAQRSRIAVEQMPAGPDGRVDPAQLEPGPDVVLAICTFQSNVNGVLQPVAAIKRQLGDIPLLVDAAQGAGEHRIDASGDNLDLVALTGHKGLLGPSGVGALYVREGLELAPLTPGGTGSRSESMEQPLEMPDSLEGGTPNIPGIVGLGAALTFLEEQGLGNCTPLVLQLIEELRVNARISLLTASDQSFQGNLFSFSIDGVDPSKVAQELYRRHGLAVRSGLHCAPAAHRHLGTFDQGGAVRISVGRFHTEGDLERISTAIQELAEEL